MLTNRVLWWLNQSKEFDISFINLQKKNTILQNLKQTITCINHKFIQQNCIRKKNYKTSKHSNKIHILQKHRKKLTFKNCVQIRKKVDLLT